MNRKFTKLVVAVFGICVWLGFASVGSAQDQVSDVKASHNEGQTFITWKEPGEPTVGDNATDKEMRKAKKDMEKTKLRFNIYRSDKPITSLEGATLVGSTGPMSCWNWTYYGFNEQNKPSFRYVIKEGSDPVPNGNGLYVHNPKAAGKGYYAVTMVKDGNENKTIGKNVTADGVDEKVGLGVPVLQKKEKQGDFNGIKNPELHYYVRWDAPPNGSKENLANDYLVCVPPNPPTPAPVTLGLHCWGGSQFSGYGWWQSHMKEGTTYMITTNQMPYDWWTGYNEFYWETEGQKDDQKKDKWKSGKIYPYTQLRILSFLDWATPKYNLDPKRVGANGNSMGGAGAPMLAVRYPDRIAWCVSWVGVHNPNNTPQYKGGYEKCWGKQDWAVPYMDGSNVWDHYNDVWYLKKHPEVSTGLIIFANGKDDIGIGWEQALEFLNALQETKQPHIFRWGMNGHGQRTLLPNGGGEKVLPIDVSIDKSLPAFTKCSLDNDPGTGKKVDTPKEIKINERQVRKDIFDGDAIGQINQYLYWKTDDAVDTADKWEMTILIADEAKSDDCTVNVTPRRCQQFKPKAGDKLKWTNKDKDGKEVASGEITADQYGLVTIEKAAITKAGNRISITK